MTGSLPQEARDCFERFVTTEYTTIDSRQQPITWPVTPYYSQGGPTIDVTTGIGYPKKADDAERNPRVALLFSDPTGSGLERPAEVLVQGTAQIDDANLDANADRYMRESGEKLPKTKKMHPPKFVRGALRWYYARIYVSVRPERVFIWRDGDPTVAPEILDAHLEEVRSGHVEEPEVPRAPASGGAVPWDDRMQELGSRYPEAVLSWAAPDGFPLAVRLPITLDGSAQRVRLEAEPAGLPLNEGRACLTAHSHGPGFEWQENFQVRGDVVRGEGGWELVPHKLVGGFELPKGMKRTRDFIKKHRRFYRTAKQRLAEREVKPHIRG
jgi:hypothetical protein